MSEFPILVAGAEAADRRTDWPAASLDAVRQSGALALSLPESCGGKAAPPAGFRHANQAFAAHCATTAFILSQREAAVRRLLTGPDHLIQRYGPGLAAGAAFLTVGLSQLTTSRQHGGPALRATPLPAGGYRFDGDIPWVTGADHADALVVGATLPDGLQVLAVLPTDRPGMTVGPPMELAALCGSRTAAVRCDGAEVAADDVLAGPTEKVLGATGGGGLDTSSLALGVAEAAVDGLKAEADRRAELVPVYEAFEAARSRVQHRLTAADADPSDVAAVRVNSTRLALRATQAYLMATKGAGFVAPHPAQRLARQALFFLVWSCPRPVADDVLADLIPGPDWPSKPAGL